MEHNPNRVHALYQDSLSILSEHIPGCIHQCLADTDFTLLSISGGFLNMFGYTREEIKELFDDKFIDMIYEEDRAEVLRHLFCHGEAAAYSELEYRVIRKSQSPVWVLDKSRLVILEDGTATYCSVILDVTAQREERDHLRLSLERHRVIMDQTTDIIFEWDIRKDTLVFSSNFKKTFGYEPTTEQISAALPLSKNIHVNDMHRFLKLMDRATSGVPYSETEFRIRDVSGNFTWRLIRSTTQYDSLGNPLKAVGVIINIDKEKKDREQLLKQASQDSLTGLLNKETIRLTINHILSIAPQQCGTLFIIDLDNFKYINDHFGHLYGDIALSEVADKLKHLFHSSDPIGRIGGDEFLIYVSGLDRGKASERAELIMKTLSEIQVESRKGLVGCSIGAAFYPSDGHDYYTLYKRADEALYSAKYSGKGQFYLYGTTANYPSKLIRSVIGSIIDSDCDHVTATLAQYCFRMLYNAIDIELAVSQILEIVGRSYSVSRAYIFENSTDGKYCSNTFEWCAEGITPQINELQQLCYETDMYGFVESIHEKGFVYYSDIHELPEHLFQILEPQGIRAILQCGIWDDGVFLGYVGFDECMDNRIWTQEQVDALTLTSNVLSTFLLKHRLKERLKALTEHE